MRFVSEYVAVAVRFRKFATFVLGCGANLIFFASIRAMLDSVAIDFILLTGVRLSRDTCIPY